MPLGQIYELTYFLGLWFNKATYLPYTFFLEKSRNALWHKRDIIISWTPKRRYRRIIALSVNWAFVS